MNRTTKICVLVLLDAWICGATLGAQSPPTDARGIRTVGNRTIGGVVISGVNGEPMADAGVTLLGERDGQEVAEAATDLEGRFRFANLPDGRYELSASHRGFVTADFEDHEGFSTAIVTGEGLDTIGLRFTLEPQAAIYGTITEDSGDPVPQARVSLYHRAGGWGRIMRAGETVADAMGHFEFPRLGPGSYYVCAAGEPWYRTDRPPAPDPQGNAAGERPRSPLDVAYPLTCYPDTTDSNAAELVRVNAGDRVVADLTLHPAPATHISVEIPDPGGRRRAPMAPQISENVFGMPEMVQTSPASIVQIHGRDGSAEITMEMSGVAPGEYEVQLPAASQAGGSGGITTVDATSDRVNLDLSSIPPLAEVSGKVSMAGGARLPDGLSAALMPGQSEEQAFAQVDSDGSFKFQAVRPGNYTVLLQANSLYLFVARLKASGGKADGRVVEVGGDPVALTVVAAEANATVSGFANLNGKPAPGVFVVLVPADPGAGQRVLSGQGVLSEQRVLSEAGASSADQTDSDGSFILLHVMPGAYTLVAVEEGWTLDWERPEAMARYVAKGEKINVAQNAKQIDLKSPVEVQAK